MKKYLLYIGLLLLSPSVSQAQENLIENSSFEQGMASWQLIRTGKTGTAKITPGDAADGQHALTIQLPQSAAPLVLRSSPFEVEPGQTYQVKLNYFTGDQNYTGTSIRILAFDKNSRSLGHYLNVGLAPTANTWVQEMKPFQVPANTHRVIVQINFRNGVHCRIDNIQFSKIDENNPDNSSGVLSEGPPVFNELLIPGTQPITPRPMPYWGYDISDVEMYRNAALRYGHEYVLENRYQDLAAKNWAVFDYQGKFPELRKKYQNPTNYFIFEGGHFLDHAFKIARDRGAPVFSRNRPSPIDPIYVDAVVELLGDKNTLINRSNRPHPQFVTFVDELFLKTTTILPREKRTSDFWKNADEVVRTKYGYGKYGMPESSSDTDPLKWIAYFRWQSDLAADALKKIGTAVKKIDPNIQFLGTDEHNIPTPYDWEKIAQNVDVQMNQVLPLLDGWSSYNAGFMTKFMTDLSRKPVYPYFQIIKYGNTPQPEAIFNWTNLALRSGAKGLFVGAVEWFDRDLNHPMYASPENWQFYTDLVQSVQNLPEIQYPARADVALHYSSFSNMANGRRQNASLYGAAYVFLGPRAGSWFKVTDDFQLERDAARWNSYRVVVAPDMTYASPLTLDGIRSYVGQGGTLIFTNPNSLSSRVDGVEMEQTRQELLGVTFGSESVQRELTWAGVDLNNPSGLARKVEKIHSPATAIAHFADGSPAIIERRLGQGKILTFAFNPNHDGAIKDSAWKEAWQKVLAAEGVGTNHEIWRFTLPKPRKISKPADVCITNNAVWMHQNQVDLSLNRSIEGKYWYRKPPQKIADTVLPEIPLAQGKLTNRTVMANAAKNERGALANADNRDVSKWIVEFGENETAENDLYFDFAKPRNLTRARLAFSGFLPAVEVFVSDNGRQWKKAGDTQAVDAGDDVMLKEIKMGQKARFVRFAFAQRPTGTALKLSEVDVWAMP